MSTLQLKQISMMTIEYRYGNHLKVYTDGSKKNNPLSTTAAFTIPEMDLKTNWKLHPLITIEGAEMSAIVKATEKLLEMEVQDKPIVILTDSRVDLQLIKQRSPKTLAVLSNLSRLNKTKKSIHVGLS